MLITRRWNHESGDHQHRFLTGRELAVPVQGDLLEGWHVAETRKTINFVVFNPRFADARSDDALVLRCMAFASRWQYRRLLVTALFSRVTSDLDELRRVDATPNIENDRWIVDAARQSATVVCAWGVYGGFRGRADHVLELLSRTGIPITCLGETTRRHPRHPLASPLTATPRPWDGHRTGAPGHREASAHTLLPEAHRGAWSLFGQGAAPA